MCKLLLAEDDTVWEHMCWVIRLRRLSRWQVWAVELKLTAAEWKKIVFPHPTVGEIFKEAL